MIFAGFTHEPAEKLAEKITSKLPKNLNRVFYSDNGSTAIEVALKVSYQYWQNVGENRTTFICFDGAYHGDTLGAMSVESVGISLLIPLMILCLIEVIPFPETQDNDIDRATKEDAVIEKLEELLDINPSKHASIIMEPLIQGAGGMRMCSEEFIQKIHWVNRQFDVLLIFDGDDWFWENGDYFCMFKKRKLNLI